MVPIYVVPISRCRKVGSQTSRHQQTPADASRRQLTPADAAQQTAGRAHTSASGYDTQIFIFITRGPGILPIGYLAIADLRQRVSHTLFVTFRSLPSTNKKG